MTERICLVISVFFRDFLKQSKALYCLARQKGNKVDTLSDKH